jgi:hypothetical protein
VTNVIKVFTWAVQERNIVFVSDNPTVLSLAVEAFCAILWPIKWVGQLVTVQPQVVIGYVTTPTPAMFGVLRPTFSLINRAARPVGALIVDLDVNEVVEGREKVVPLPAPARDNLERDLTLAFDRVMEIGYPSWDPWQAQPRERLQTFQREAQASFVRFFALILGLHRRYILLDKQIPAPNWFVLRENFIAASQSHADFMQAFLRTQQCTQFIESRPLPRGDVFDAVVLSEIWNMRLEDASLYLEELIERGPTHLRPPPESTRRTNEYPLEPVSYAPTVPVPPEKDSFAHRMAIQLVTHNITTDDFHVLRVSLQEEMFRRLMLTKLTETLARLGVEPHRDVWRVPPEAQDLLKDFFRSWVTLAISQSEYLTIAGVLVLCRNCDCSETLLLPLTALLKDPINSDKDIAFWRTFQAI